MMLVEVQAVVIEVVLNVLSGLLSRMFNQSVKFDFVTNLWKARNATPTFKKENMSFISNYRIFS